MIVPIQVSLPVFLQIFVNFWNCLYFIKSYGYCDLKVGSTFYLETSKELSFDFTMVQFHYQIQCQVPWKWDTLVGALCSW